ncbi:MAG TPA: SURF1 family cytochrome oxidase biogenesis protein, partial [Caulobacter sp.]|nr:SURF1 family cytochrome oxidase biogenesis protein [Caulobacter sp.]
MSEAPKKAGFPFGLTIATLVAFAILCGLGVWQVKRLAWKEDLLARIERLKTAPAQPVAAVVARAAKGEDVAWTRVSVDCASDKPQTLPLVYGVRDGDIVWRATAICRTSAAGYGAILLDLGVVKALTGQSAPA